MTVNGRCDFDVDNVCPNDIRPIIFPLREIIKTKQEQRMTGIGMERDRKIKTELDRDRDRQEQRQRQPR